MLRAPPEKIRGKKKKILLTSFRRPRFLPPLPPTRFLSNLWAEVGFSPPFAQSSPPPSLRKSILVLFGDAVRHPHFPQRELDLFISLFFPWPTRLGLVVAQTPGGSRRGSRGFEKSTSRRCPPIERDSARAGCVTRDVSTSYRCSGW